MIQCLLVQRGSDVVVDCLVLFYQLQVSLNRVHTLRGIGRVDIQFGTFFI